MRGEFKDMLDPDTNNSFHMLDGSDDHDMEAMDDAVAVYSDVVPKKIRRKAVDVLLDPTDAHFAIQEEADGTVVVLSDDSEVSAFTTEELEALRRQYAKAKSHGLTDDQRKQRAFMINELKSQLKIEEVKLQILKKLRLSQTLPSFPQTNTPSMFTARTPNYEFIRDWLQQHGGPYQNLPGRPTAYCPPVATPNQIKGAPINPKLYQDVHSRNKMGAQGNNNGFVIKLNSMAGNGKASGGAQMGVAAQSQKAAVVPELQSPAQQYATAKLALRKQLEKTLLQIPPPKPPPPEMDFIPNPHQGDFICLVGLDEIVQRLLQPKEKAAAAQAASSNSGSPAKQPTPTSNSSNKDARGGAQSQPPQQNGVASNESNNVAEACATTTGKRHVNSTSAAVVQSKAAAGTTSNACLPATPSSTTITTTTTSSTATTFNMPFTCAQCGTDFTPYWKMQMGKVVCEHCIRSNERAVLKSEHTSRLKQAFVKALQQEQEIDRQIQEGSFNFSALTAAAAGSSMDAASSASSSVSAAPHSGATAAGSKSATTKGGVNAAAAAAAAAACSALNSSSDALNDSVATAIRNATMAVAAAGNMAYNPLAAAGIPIGFSPQLMSVGWNPLLAAGRFPAAAAAAAAAAANMPAAWIQNLPRELVKHLQMQQRNAAVALQRQLFIDMLPQQRPQKWK